MLPPPPFITRGHVENETIDFKAEVFYTVCEVFLYPEQSYTGSQSEGTLRVQTAQG
jgi:hypothetical protein